MYLCDSFYLGRCSLVMVADLEMVKQVTVTHFDHFMDREVSMYIES